MKSLTTAMLNHLAGDTHTLAMCWKITRKDGAQFGFTSLDTDLEISGLNYEALPGITPTDISASSAFDVDNLDIAGAINSDTITDQDIINGLWDGAFVETFLVNYKDLTMGTIPEKSGYLGQLRHIKDHSFTTEMRSLMQLMQQPAGETYTKTCRVAFCSDKCGLNAGDYTASGTLDSVDGRTLTDAERTEPDGTYTNGMLTFTSGANSGASYDVQLYTAGQIKLLVPPRRQALPGDTYTIVQRCDKSQESCIAYGNIENFRGFPYMTTTDTMMQYPG